MDEHDPSVRPDVSMDVFRIIHHAEGSSAGSFPLLIFLLCEHL